MTYDQIEINAYNEARLDFISRMLGGYKLESAYVKRQEVFEASKRVRCTCCLIEKHLSEFYGKTNTSPQAYCKECNLKVYHQRANREKWKAVKATPL